jgi:nucleoside-diphosphate-sugar epimerase
MIEYAGSHPKKRQIIVTGATGFVGRHLVPLLLNNNHEVVAVARDVERARSLPWYSSVNFVSADIHRGTFEIPFQSGASLIHLAWQGLPNYTSLFHFEQNLPRSYEFIKQLIARGVDEVLVTGTCLEYGLKSGPLGPNTPTRPLNSYALAKDVLRQYLARLQEEKYFKLKWARLFYMFGEGQNNKSVIAQLDAAIDAGEQIFNMSGGEQLRDYLPVQSAAKKLIDILEGDPEGNFNVCSGKPISIRRLVEERIKAKNSSIQVNLGHYPYLEYEPMAFWGEE